MTELVLEIVIKESAVSRSAKMSQVTDRSLLQEELEKVLREAMDWISLSKTARIMDIIWERESQGIESAPTGSAGRQSGSSVSIEAESQSPKRDLDCDSERQCFSLPSSPSDRAQGRGIGLALDTDIEKQDKIGCGLLTVQYRPRRQKPESKQHAKPC
ncbi:unnamed protein product [Acanthoscelides obtectus]|uniref:Uncharacterized protein n=1 Tax=Acanthoscelides obtectus TaxID=200917 RepID=A0A9P0JU63_ACAOB|nr:unnamed protein product [Acanthoscelides obtectus]CAK1641315.1 hypothetical protein AOBTE_LOCUS12326 [Acanthoscelides obtectus]